MIAAAVPVNPPSVLVALAVAACVCGVPAPQAERDALSRTLEEFCAAHDIPAVAAAVFEGGDVVARGVAGTRALGTDDPVEITDRFHIGSCGKSMTSALIATLVEAGDLSWETRIIDVFPEWRAVMRPEYEPVTLVHLLSHTAALPDPWVSIPWKDVAYAPAQWPAEQRAAMARGVLAMEPIGVPGKVQQYSNHGYGIAAAMAERVTRRSWSCLLRERVLDPLGLASVGFGPPASFAGTAAPHGHARRDDAWTPIGPEVADFRVPPSIAPAGDVHCTIDDFARWAGAHLSGLRGANDGFLTAASIRKMHTPVMSNYALGWRVETSSGGTRVHMHQGSEGTFQSVMAVMPSEDLAVVVVATGGGTGRACNRLLFELANRYAGATSSRTPR